MARIKKLINFGSLNLSTKTSGDRAKNSKQMVSKASFIVLSMSKFLAVLKIKNPKKMPMKIDKDMDFSSSFLVFKLAKMINGIKIKAT